MSSFLQNYQRQPKLFIDLPSNGKFYDDTIIKDGQFVQIPVFGMNAMDEIMFKTPDALFSGEATAEVIRSCIPTILDPWKLVGYDIDYILIALRIATYGNNMPVSTVCPKCAESSNSEIGLGKLLDGFTSYETDYDFQIDNLVFNLKPITYRLTTDFSVEKYLLDRELYQVENLDIDRDEKNKKMQDIYVRASKLNMRLAIAHVKSVSDEENQETNLEAITEFIVNNDAVFFDRLRTGIQELTSKWNIPQFNITCSGEECHHQYMSALTVDYSNFFGARSLISRNLVL
tara:strand:+ start:1701 stop:2564 length:864 start_codon:yes stop_codon:yes gene_type:complete